MGALDLYAIARISIHLAQESPVARLPRLEINHGATKDAGVIAWHLHLHVFANDLGTILFRHQNQLFCPQITTCRAFGEMLA